MKTKSSADHGIRDIYGDVTAKIVASMEAGTAPWAQHWRPGVSATRRLLRNSGEPYRGINALLLWTAAQEQGFVSDRRMSYAQAEAVGGHVQKGERGCMVVYANRISNGADTSNGGELATEKLAATSMAYLRTYMVFIRRQTPQDESGRMWDVVWRAYRRPAVSQVDVTLFRAPCDGRSRAPRAARPLMHIGPGDQGEPVITIMMPGED